MDFVKKQRRILFVMAVMIATTLTPWLHGCAFPQTPATEISSQQACLIPPENQTQSTESIPVQEPEPEKIVPQETIPGIKPAFNDCLDVSSDQNTAWIQAFLKRTDGAWMNYALRLAESDEKQLTKAMNLIENIRNNPRDYSLDDVFDYHLGRLWLRYADSCPENETENALKKAYQYFGKVRSYRQSPYYHLSREGNILAALRLNLDISDELSAFILDYPNYPGLLEFKYRLALLEYQSGKTDKAIADIQDLYFWNPWSPVSQKAGEWLNQHDLSDRERSFDEVFSRVETLRKARFWDEAENAASEALPLYPESYQLAVQHARIAYERSYHEEAAHRFENILERLNGETKDKLKPSGVIAYIYRAYGYMGDCEKALQYHAKNFSKFGKKDRARYTMEFALTCGSLDIAYNNAKIVFDNPTDADAYDYAFLAYLNEDYDTARQYFTIANETLTGTYKRRSAYFLAQATLKSALKLQSQTESEKDKKTTSTKSKKSKKTSSKSSLPKPTIDSAQKQFKALISADSNDYYAILAWSRLAEIARTQTDDIPQTPVIQQFADQIIQDPEPFRPWTQEYTFDEKAALDQFEENVEKYKDIFPSLQRVAFFHDAELYRERNQTFRLIAIETMGIGKLKSPPAPNNLWTTKLSVDGHLVDNRKHDTGIWGMALNQWWFELPDKKDISTRETMADHQKLVYDNYSSLSSFIRETLPAFHDYYLTRKYTPSPDRTCGSEDNIQNCSKFYPHAFSHEVIKASKDNHITPDLIWAVMNIESAFNPDSISHADAYGLLQIIPMTGYKIANAMEDTDFGPYDLIRPEYSIRMGTWYFSQILHKFKGYATLSMAAYNGGPHQVARWLTAYKNVEHDAFIELIPYNEARNYVKKGMARLLIFHRIDNKDPGYFFEIPNTLPDSFEEMPNY